MAELDELREEVRTLRKLVLEHDTYINGLYRKLDPNTSCVLVTQQDFVKFWELTVTLWAKKEWDLETEIRPFYSSVWFLMGSGLRRVESIARDRYCWTKILKLLQRMRYWLETDNVKKAELESQFVSENLLAAEARFRYFMVSYLFEFAPEIHERLETEIVQGIDRLGLPRKF